MSKLILVTILYFIVILFFLFFSEKNNNYEKYINDNIDVYVINLDRSKDRMKKIREYLSKYKLNSIRIPAIDGKKYKTKSELNKSENFENLTCMSGDHETKHITHNACYLSHIKCLKAIIDSDKEWGVIFEDDVQLSGNVQKVLANCTKRNYDFCYLNKSNNNLKNPPTTEAYIISKRSAKIVYDCMIPGSDFTKEYKNKTCLYDWMIYDILKSKNLKIGCFNIAKQSGDESNINVEHCPFQALFKK